MQRHVKDQHAEAIAAAENAQTSFACGVHVCPGLTWDTKKGQLDAHCQSLHVHHSFQKEQGQPQQQHENIILLV